MLMGVSSTTRHVLCAMPVSRWEHNHGNCDLESSHLVIKTSFFRKKRAKNEKIRKSEVSSKD